MSRSGARTRRSLFPINDPLVWLRSVVTIGFVFAFLMTVNLWLNVRSYPLVPAIGGLPPITHPFDFILFGALLVLLATIFISSRPQLYIWIFLGLLGVLCIYDQTRWQPYVYQYAFLFAALASYSWKSNDAASRSRALNIARFIMASTYVYSGLQKMNPGFVQQVWPWLVQPLTHAYPFATQPILLMGFIAPFIQVAFGIMLLSKRFRKPAVVLAVAMHAFILAMIGPWALDWNSVVWPWTIAMACFDIILFGTAENFSYKEVLWPKDSVLYWIVLVLFGIMPALSFFNLWDSDLSAALYSGNLTEGNIYVSDAGKSELPADVQQYVVPAGTDNNVLSVKAWALGDMNAIEYPETRVFQGLAKSLCSGMADPSQLILVVQESRLFRSGGQLTYRCSEL